MMPAERAEALLDAVAAELAGQGFVLRGGFLFSPGEVAPAGPDGAPARSVLMVGQAGAGPWPHFQRWRATQPAGLANPYDRFAQASSPAWRPDWRPRRLALGPALSAVPAMGHARRGSAAVAARHPDASRIRALARLSRRPAVCREISLCRRLAR